MELNKVDIDCFGRIRCHTQILLSTWLVWLWLLYLFPKVSQCKLLNHWLSITFIHFPIFMLSTKLLTYNIWKHHQIGYKDNHEWKQNEKSNWSWCAMPPLFKRKKKEEKRKYGTKLRGGQVMLYVDQQGHVKHKFGDLSSTWPDVFFNLTKDMTRSLLTNSFRNIELDNKSYSLEY